MSLFQPWLITLDEVRGYRRIPSAKSKDDELISDMISEASEFFISQINRTPLPMTLTRLYDYGGAGMPSVRELNSGEDLLSVATLTNGDASVIASADFVLEDANVFPKRAIRLKLNSGITFFYDTDPEQSISVAGQWGYVPHFGRHWKNITTLSSDITTTTAVTMGVTAADNVRVGDYLRINSDEVVFVTDIVGTTISIDRGELGSTAATATSADTVDQFQQVRDIKGAVKEIVGYLYKTKDKAGARVKVFDGGTVTVEELPPSVQQTINRHQKIVWMVA